MGPPVQVSESSASVPLPAARAARAGLSVPSAGQPSSVLQGGVSPGEERELGPPAGTWTALSQP